MTRYGIFDFLIETLSNPRRTGSYHEFGHPICTIYHGLSGSNVRCPLLLSASFLTQGFYDRLAPFQGGLVPFVHIIYSTASAIPGVTAKSLSLFLDR
jgi:hypothetical protein